MGELLLVRVNPEHDDRFTWLSLDKKGKPAAETGTGTLEQLSAEAKHKRVVLLVPGSDVLLSPVDVPGTGRVPAPTLTFALEEYLADDIEALYFANGPRQADGMVPTAAIRKSKLNNWLNSLEQADLHPAWVVPESILLPRSEGEWSMLQEGGQVTLRYGQNQGIAAEVSSLKPVLVKLLRERDSDEPPAVRLWSADEAPGIRQLLEDLGCSIEQKSMSADVLQLFSKAASERPDLNLLQNVKRHADSAGSSRGWIAAAAMLLLALFIHLGGSGYHYWQLKEEQADINGQIERLFAETFPEVTRIVDPLVQAEQKLAERKRANGEGSDVMLDLLHQAGRALRQDRTLQLTGLEFRRGVMHLRLLGKSVSGIEGLKQRLEKSGQLEVEVLSVTSTDKGVEGRLKMRGRA